MTTDRRDWHALQEHSHLPEAQAAIRAAVRAGAVRIAPLGIGRVRIIPLDRGRAAAVRPTPARVRDAGSTAPAVPIPGLMG